MYVSGRHQSHNHRRVRTIKNVKRQHWLNKKLYIVENVQAEVCTERGERDFHANTLDALDAYLSEQHVVKEQLNVKVVSFNQAMA
jgi:hypothetical protein